jgi:5-enolpyruvylshikimate-3-phosphate synthase
MAGEFQIEADASSASYFHAVSLGLMICSCRQDGESSQEKSKQTQQLKQPLGHDMGLCPGEKISTQNSEPTSNMYSTWAFAVFLLFCFRYL